MTKHLGAGQFGTVNKGVWLSPGGEEVPVAVKMLQLKATEPDRVRFLQEAAIMGQFHHPNVVKLHGVVTRDDPVSLLPPQHVYMIYHSVASVPFLQIMIVLEYMTNGDLRKSLVNLRPK